MTENEYRHLRRIEMEADSLHYRIMLWGEKPEYVSLAVQAAKIRGELNRILNSAPLPSLMSALDVGLN